MIIEKDRKIWKINVVASTDIEGNPSRAYQLIPAYVNGERDEAGALKVVYYFYNRKNTEPFQTGVHFYKWDDAKDYLLKNVGAVLSKIYNYKNDDIWVFKPRILN